jgi:hypothetical protein
MSIAGINFDSNVGFGVGVFVLLSFGFCAGKGVIGQLLFFDSSLASLSAWNS